MKEVSRKEKMIVNGGRYHTGSGGDGYMEPLDKEHMYEDRVDIDFTPDSPVTFEDSNDDGDSDLNISVDTPLGTIEGSFDHDGDQTE